MTVATQPITAEEFWNQYSEEGTLELVRGEVRPLMSPGGEHGIFALNLGTLLRLWVGQAGGRAGVESGFKLSTNPDSVRGPDVYYVRPEHIPATGAPKAFWNRAPDLAVEIVSPSERAGALLEKVNDYLEGGTQLVWLVYPELQQVVAYTPDDTARVFKSGDTLEDERVLPGFRCLVSEIFE